MQEHLPSGTHHATCDGSDIEGNRVRTGVYYLRAQTGDELATRKIVMLQ